ncbi:ClbS/DfsB family four-helix bundle protein [Pseudoalteromonas sp. SG45-5]|uniref:ClbS/DfsB family four-helix bundle protein n=1 Tax=unclassified Pseudoalteromonas TaxID=194690 RepID=UPI0015FDEAFC|nr:MULTISPECIES: ClbS/DfsB family four-helix bundle protein [unclassified Pseudoalteromonas]MBB1384307.1 ClbS/DfsB family four-helix bundle protein [Pseudoalteromonas sp. SG45-5]MBB1393990.1 ClbS/DfsB family four-helix bundle protein [Pseudoalteromonas sp. SG44-4]MBB1445764.1 ClbS/DfsB family four-helix bundle protein [Pseudoalteromonas sp. SG41-6]
MSSVPTNKEELYRAIKLNSEKILEDYLSIPKEYAHKNGIEGNVKGAIINVADTLAYLIGWGQLVLKWHELKSEGSNVDFPETGYKWNELGQLAQYFQLQFKSWSYSHLILEFAVTIAKILSLIESLDNHSLYGTAWYEKYTLGKMIQLNTSSPMKNMRAKVRRFKKINQI